METLETEHQNTEHVELVISCTPGLEGLLEDEIRELCPEISKLQKAHSSIRLEVTPDELTTLVVMSRISSRMHIPIREFSAKNPAMLYDQVRRIDWASYLRTEDTFRIQGRGQITDVSMNFAVLKIKDGICDEIKKQGFDRPNVDRKNPDISLTAFFTQDRCELLLDLSTDALHRRGYGEKRGLAPLRENRAAALIRFAKMNFGPEIFDGPIVDPFCGSGTLILEALLYKAGAPARVHNPVPVGFAKACPSLNALANKKATKAKMAADIYFEEREGDTLAYAYDIDPEVLDAAGVSIQRARLSKYVKVKKADARDLKHPGAFIVCNPPWGDRLDNEEASQLLSDFGHTVKHKCAPAKIAMALGQGLSKRMGFRPSHRQEVENGADKMDFCLYEVYEGSRKES